jgi:renalase
MADVGLDVVIIGAGISGLTAAQALHSQGYRVAVVDKSRGLGGRMATRRRGTTIIDHGCRYLEPEKISAWEPLTALLEAGTIRPWQPEGFTLGADGSLSATGVKTLYGARQGMSAIAKALAPGLPIHRSWRATALTPIDQGWRITGAALGEGDRPEATTMEARAIVVAIPAPQALDLIAGVAQHHSGLQDWVRQLQTVSFDPVITVMAGYGPQPPELLPGQTQAGGWMIDGNGHPMLRWLALDSSKRTAPPDAVPETVVVLHSSSALAAEVIDRTDLDAVGQALLAAAHPLATWLSQPQWMQVHRWRYGFVQHCLGTKILHSPAIPTLVGCGDWCMGENVTGAIASGTEAAAAIAPALQQS